jgi:hypothetical protein
MSTCMYGNEFSAAEGFASYFASIVGNATQVGDEFLESNQLSKEIKRILRDSEPTESEIGERGYRQEAEDSENSLGLMSWCSQVYYPTSHHTS